MPQVRPIEYRPGVVRMLDQRRLPLHVEYLELTNWLDVASGIRDMAVRGAPAIGIAAAYGLVLAAEHGADFNQAVKGLAESRPTAVNLFIAINRMVKLGTTDPVRLLAEAQAIEAEEIAMNEAIGLAGAELIPAKARVLTVCNTGALATAGIGTALGIIRVAHRQGKIAHVYSCETRPRQQGLRLTAWELMQEGIPFQSIADGMAGALMAQGKVDFVVAGADRIARNGDTANKIGTYSLAVLAHHHGIPFAIAAPSSTFDKELADGSGIPIEEREASEITHIEGVQVAPTGCPVWNPGFDVTPGHLISAIVTEKGVHRPLYSF